MTEMDWDFDGHTGTDFNDDGGGLGGSGLYDPTFTPMVSGDTQALMDSINAGMADAQAIYEGALEGVGTAPAVGGDTGALLDSINTSMGHAGTLYDEALDPGSADAGDLAEAQQHADIVAGNLGWMQGQVTADEMHQDAVSDQARTEAEWRARETAAETQREAELAEYRADWEVWESERERGA